MEKTLTQRFTFKSPTSGNIGQLIIMSDWDEDEYGDTEMISEYEIADEDGERDWLFHECPDPSELLSTICTWVSQYAEIAADAQGLSKEEEAEYWEGFVEEGLLEVTECVYGSVYGGSWHDPMNYYELNSEPEVLKELGNIENWTVGQETYK